MQLKKYYQRYRTNFYNMWVANDRCPPVVMAADQWFAPLTVGDVRMTPAGTVEIEFYSEPGQSYPIEFTDDMTDGIPVNWQTFVANGTMAAPGTTTVFTDDFTANTSGSASTNSARFYRVKTP